MIIIAMLMRTNNYSNYEDKLFYIKAKFINIDILSNDVIVMSFLTELLKFKKKSLKCLYKYRD